MRLMVARAVAMDQEDVMSPGGVLTSVMTRANVAA